MSKKSQRAEAMALGPIPDVIADLDRRLHDVRSQLMDLTKGMVGRAVTPPLPQVPDGMKRAYAEVQRIHRLLYIRSPGGATRWSIENDYNDPEQNERWDARFFEGAIGWVRAAYLRREAKLKVAS